jgi:hypothetical protein
VRRGSAAASPSRDLMKRGRTTVAVRAEASFAALEYVTNEPNRIRWLEMHKMRLEL